MSTLAVILVVVIVLWAAMGLFQWKYSDRSGSLDDQWSGPIRHQERRSPREDTGRRRDHDW